ncbi:MAG: exo-beta-N-acetylmuramidase NamZ domain-containing protein [Mangrovibacterium sp.]
MKQLFFLICITICSCSNAQNNAKNTQPSTNESTTHSTPNKNIETQEAPIVVGAAQSWRYLNAFKDKKVGLVANQSSIVGKQHLLDFLLENQIQVTKIFTPEHGFRGNVDAGELISNDKDSKTGLPIISLYGKSKKPSAAQFADLDIIVFDMQDVGARFYTYYCTMFYVMQTCAETNKTLWLLDRPNPNGDYVAGPILNMKYKSFVGLLPIPVVHGCTLGELAQMINGENWLGNNLLCPLHVVAVENYTHQTPYSLPVKPSPNLPNDISIRLYPSLCFFEATSMSVGRGTDFPFQVVGYPDANMGDFSFTPRSIPGAASDPKLKGQLCHGTDYRSEGLNHRFTLEPFMNYYHKFSTEESFVDRKNWFQLLIGNDQTLSLIASGCSWEELENSWKKELRTYLEMRKKYLLYKDDFELSE